MGRNIRLVSLENIQFLKTDFWDRFPEYRRFAFFFVKSLKLEMLLFSIVIILVFILIIILKVKNE